MTLYWYVHWFWITCQCYACLCDEASIISATKATNFSVNDEKYRPAKAFGSISSNPANTIINATTSVQLHRSINSTTPVPPIRLTAAVIDMNTIDLSSNSTDNQTLNRTENLTYFEDEKYINKSATSNSEQVGDDVVRPADNLSAAGITGITLGCVTIVGLISAISYGLYRNRGFNRPQVLNDHCSNLDSSGYIDDTSVRDNSEEMYSLDNDSFLNSLEAMTIQNYWTDTVKHTKL